MKILLTNDDGIHAPGIEALYMALADPDGSQGGPIAEDFLIVAPLTPQSAASHAVTFKTPLMTSIETVSPQMSGIAVDGRPADCVKLAISSIWPEKFGADSKPDLVISGLNAGANVGINVIYSGTVAAALEAAFLGVPSIAVSLHLGPDETCFDLAARWARHAIEAVLRGSASMGEDTPFAPHSCVSINITLVERPGSGASGVEAPPPIVVCPMNTHALNDAYEKRTSPTGQTYYWSTGSGLDFTGADPNTDVEQLFESRITITPLKYDLTWHEAMAPWRRLLDS